MDIKTSRPSDKKLLLTAMLDAPREKIFRCWTEPDLMVKWFAPKPWTLKKAETDVRVGGRYALVMRGPNEETTTCPCEGVYLAVVPNEKIVFTDAFTRAWEPSEKPFVTSCITFEDGPSGKTKYTAQVSHWKKEDCDDDEKMGFHDGWTLVTQQLNEIARRI